VSFDNKACLTIGRKTMSRTQFKLCSLTMKSSLLMVLALPVYPAQCAEVRKIAILPFDFNSTGTGVQTNVRNAVEINTGGEGINSTSIDIGREISHLLGADLTSEGSYDVEQVDDITASTSQSYGASLSPQTFGSQGREDPTLAVSIGRRIDVDAVLIGTVTDFKLDVNRSPGLNSGAVVSTAAVSAASGAAVGMALSRSRSSAAPYIGSLAGLAGLFAVAAANMPPRGKVKAVIEAKLIDVATGDTLITLGGAGESKHSTTKLWDTRQNVADFTSPGFAETPAGEAAIAAVQPICAQLNRNVGKVDALSKYHVQGIVTDVDDGLICVSAGKQDGFQPGNSLKVDRPIVANTPGQKPRVGNGLTNPVGGLLLTFVGKEYSVGEMSAEVGSTTPRVGDYIRKEQATAVTQQPSDKQN
jgi:hypothetical protein